MWTEIKKTPNLVVAELWKDLFDSEGIIAFIAPDVPNWEGVSQAQPRRIMIPISKKHVAEEVLRKL